MRLFSWPWRRRVSSIAWRNGICRNPLEFAQERVRPAHRRARAQHRPSASRHPSRHCPRGLAPVACDSGDGTGQRRIRAGRAHVRTAIDFAGLSAARYNPDLSRVYRRLIAAGKKPKVALVAVMRKLVILANALVGQDRLWQPRPA
ncbi:MAG: transposase [Hyphomicrobiaceae bacterium]